MKNIDRYIRGHALLLLYHTCRFSTILSRSVYKSHPVALCVSVNAFFFYKILLKSDILKRLWHFQNPT